MIKLGDELKELAGSRPFYHQLCYAHGIHLAVTDILEDDMLDTESLLQRQEYQEAWRLVDAMAPVDHDPEEEYPEGFEHGSSVGRIITKIRTVCRKFQRSPVRNDELIRYAASSSTFQQLAVDVRTRWNSILEMIRTFLANEEPLREFFNSRRKEKFPFDDEELAAMKRVVACLEVAEEATLRLSSDDITLSLADIAIEEMIGNLQEMGSEFADKFRKQVCVRMLQRRGVLSRLARFVEDKEETTELDGWLESRRDEIVAEGSVKKDLIRTFLPAGAIADEIESFRSETHEYGAGPSKPSEKTTSQEKVSSKFQRAVMRRRTTLDVPEFNRMSTRRVMKLHKKGSPSMPKMIHETVATIQATSVPAERSFSRARHARSPYQERQNDERFTGSLFVQDFYARSKPYKEFLEENPITGDCKFEFV